MPFLDGIILKVQQRKGDLIELVLVDHLRAENRLKAIRHDFAHIGIG
jgi:hypothetical protein